MVPGGMHLLTTAIAMGREAAARELVQFKLPTYWGCFGRTGRVPARRSVGQGGSAIGVDKEITHVSIKVEARAQLLLKPEPQELAAALALWQNCL